MTSQPIIRPDDYQPGETITTFLGFVNVGKLKTGGEIELVITVMAPNKYDAMQITDLPEMILEFDVKKRAHHKPTSVDDIMNDGTTDE